MKAYLRFIIGTIIISPLSMASEGLLFLDLEDLSQINTNSSVATLTKTSTKKTPASTTIITSEDILDSGARNLDELLDIYVPDFAYMYKVHGNQMGFRGIISDRNNKILLLVNGKIMNIKGGDGGAITERFFSMLSDIKVITVISGPGSAVYGPGAIAGVINIETYNGNDSQGFEATLKGGMIEKFTTAEFKYAKDLSEDTSLFAYYGIDNYDSAQKEDAPEKMAHDLTPVFTPTLSITANKAIDFYTTNDNSSLNYKNRHKFHLQLNGKHFEAWARYTLTSLATPTLTSMYYFNSRNAQNTGREDEQLTVYGKYFQDITDKFSFDATASYSNTKTDVYLSRVALNENWNEDEYNLKLLTRYTGIDYDIALGTQYAYNSFGKDKALDNQHDTTYLGPLQEGDNFSTDMLSFFGEYQQNFLNNFTSFIGIRADKHKYSDWMYSPRVSLVYSQDEQNFFKLNYTKSVRHSDDADLYYIDKISGENGDHESINHFEFMYDNYFTKKSKFSLNLFYDIEDVVAYREDLKYQAKIGELELYGLKMELNYELNNYHFYISHSYTKQKDFTLDELSIQNNISASEYGYGDDLANWNNHITKLRLNYKIKHNLKWVNSLRILWGMDGAQDMSDYNIDTNGATDRKYILPYYEDDNTKAYEESIYLNTALIWKYNKSTTISLNAYNILGLFDEDYNKRNFFQTTSQYTDAAPSLSVGLNYKF
jgi:iron complex outermembrane receptor protein